MNPRLAAVRVLMEVLQGRNLPDAINHTRSDDPALTQAIAYGVARWFPQLEFILGQLVDKPLKAKDQDIQCLLFTGLFQLRFMRIPDHAAVSETVKLTDKLKKKWARGLVNAVLRNYQRQLAEIESLIEKDETACFAHPHWIIERLKKDWPDHWQAILKANNQNPPMALRINQQQTTQNELLALLDKQQAPAHAGKHSPVSVILEQPMNVAEIPGFIQGKVSVQDEAAQLAAILLDAHAGDRVLDACAAPGGKTLHILESTPGISELLAVEIDERRATRIEENLQRSGLSATLVKGDASRPEQWWDKRQFDRILLDAPCSASGVIRRHPDIKLLRRNDDIEPLQKLQIQILEALWPLLKSGGMLLYATCSVFREENEKQISTFLQTHADAQLVPIENLAHPCQSGTQVLPGEDGMDGFFYARLRKN